MQLNSFFSKLFSDMNGDPVSIGDGLLYSLIGFVLVIVVLIALMFLIKALSTVVVAFTEKKKAPEQVSTEVKTEEALAPGRSGEVKLFDVPDKEAAMVMAIVADQLQVPLNTLEFVSIKEVKDGEDQ